MIKNHHRLIGLVFSIFYLLTSLIGCLLTSGCTTHKELLQKAILDNTHITIDGDLALRICDNKPGCVFKMYVNGTERFFIYSVPDDACVLGVEVDHILKYKQTGVWKE